MIKTLNQAPGVLDRLPAQVGPSAEPESRADFKVNVLFTSPKATRSAVNIAAKLAGNLGARIRVVAPHVVPYPLQLDHPTVRPDVTERKARSIMADCTLDTEIQVCLCREKLDAAVSVLQENSVVLIGGRRRLWPTAETRLAGELRRRGHQVLFVDEE